MFGTPSGVVLSPHDLSLIGRASLELPVQKGYVIANFDPAVPAPAALVPLHGTVEAIAIAAAATGPMRLVEEAQARPDAVWREIGTPPRPARSHRPMAATMATTSPWFRRRSSTSSR